MAIVRHRFRAGFSVMEVVCCMVIIAVLADITAPVIGQGIRAAKRTRSESKLKDLARAIELYRSDYGESGGPSEIGLPLEDWFVEDYGLKLPEAIQTGGDLRYYGGKSLEPGMFTRIYPTPVDQSASIRYGGDQSWIALRGGWLRHVELSGGNVALFEDETFSNLEESNSTFFPKPVSAVFIDGHVKRRTVQGRLPLWRFELWNY